MTAKYCCTTILLTYKCLTLQIRMVRIMQTSFSIPRAAGLAHTGSVTADSNRLTLASPGIFLSLRVGLQAVLLLCSVIFVLMFLTPFEGSSDGGHTSQKSCLPLFLFSFMFSLTLTASFSVFLFSNYFPTIWSVQHCHLRTVAWGRSWLFPWFPHLHLTN